MQQHDSDVPTKLRDLDAFEEFFWLVQQSVSMFHAVVAEVHGPSTIEQWELALKTIQIRYPLLSASIAKVVGKRPFFEKVPGASMPSRIFPWTEDLVLEEEMERELNRPFGDGSGSLTRATLFHSKERSVILFATHHSSMDGKSHLLLMQDLLSLVAGESVGEPLEVQEGLGQLLGLPAPPEYARKLEGRIVAPKDGCEISMPPVRVHHQRMSAGQTEALLACAKAAGTTVHAALVTALTLAGMRYSDTWKAGPVRCMSPIDMRKSLNIPDAAGLLISVHHMIVPASDVESFWNTTRAVRETMLPAQTLIGAQHVLGGLSSLVKEEHNASDLYAGLPQSPIVHELMVTNYANYRVRTDYGGLRIENIFTGSPSSKSDLQKVSVQTVHGRLGMTLTTRDVFPTLLQDAIDILKNLSNV